MAANKPALQPAKSQEDRLDLVSATWILASNDDNPEISYRSLRQRLDLSMDVDERRLVASHPELFRLHIPQTRLEQLKERYRLGKEIPLWLRQLPKEQQTSAIEELTTEDFFRSQFRAQEDASRSPIEIIEWGLQHIDRLRTAAAEFREEKIRRWSLLWTPIVSLLIAFLSLLGSLYVSYQTGRDQSALKRYEVSFRPKLEAYTHFMLSISRSFDQALEPGPILVGTLNDADLALIQIEPLLNSKAAREKMHSDYQDFVAFCLNVNKSHKRSESDVEKFLQFRDGFRTLLYQSLFEY